MKTTGTLTLIPTPISEEGELEPVAARLLHEAATLHAEHSIFAIEDLKPGRRRWLSFKLPRESVENFVLYNEHTRDVQSRALLAALLSGKNVFLMSDGGLPAFCDPGAELVGLCHQNHIRVTSTPFCNSVMLALALSGFSHQQFFFQGFLPISSPEREEAIKSVLRASVTSIVMDTPYRLKRVLEEFREHGMGGRKKLFIAMDLNSPTEELRLGSPEALLASISHFKREFVLVLSP